ncbi:MAG TPA: RNA polymerase sigma factor [Phycisphaerae bacterium]|nr:RNA polymerase sigma factor [Phycisphaerae bacterium]
MSDTGADSDAELLRRAASRDMDALKTLLKRFGPVAREGIRGKIDSRWRSVIEEDDVMQVTYMEAFLHIDQLTARDSDAFVGWLMRIAQNTLRDAIKGLERQRRPHPARQIVQPEQQSSCMALLEILGVTTTTPSRQAAEKEAAQSIETALKALPVDYSTVVRLSDLEGKAPAEVAAAMRRSVGAVLMLRSRAHARLQQQLGAASRFFSDAP